MNAGRKHIIAVITTVIAAIDVSLSTVTNAVLHHAEFQKLEALWRNMYFLVSHAPSSSAIKIKLLSVSFAEINRDVTYALEFDQSELFNKIYSEEFGMPGGEPFGLLLGDYEVNLRQGLHQADQHASSYDIDTLRAFSDIAAAAFVPFIANLDPRSFGIDSITELEKINDFEKFFKLPEFSSWNDFRATPQARFIALTFPKTLVRKPYDKYYRRAGFIFTEAHQRTEDYLWGNANFSFAITLLRAFKEQGWFNALRGSPPVENPRGRVDHLPELDFETDSEGLAPRPITQSYITDNQEKILSDAGFIPLCTAHYTKKPIFYSDRSTQQLTVNYATNISVLLQYLLCACRFAHYVKIIGRNKMGAFLNPQDCENYLNQWLLDYTVTNDDLSWEQQAKYPLKHATVTVTSTVGTAGHFRCLMNIEPHFYIEQLESTFLLVTELSPELAK